MSLGAVCPLCGHASKQISVPHPYFGIMYTDAEYERVALEEELPHELGRWFYDCPCKRYLVIFGRSWEGEDVREYILLEKVVKPDCQFSMSPSGEYGFNSGRPRYKVECRTCGVVLHESTTGPMERVNQHLKERARDGNVPG